MQQLKQSLTVVQLSSLLMHQCISRLIPSFLCVCVGGGWVYVQPKGFDNLCMCMHACMLSVCVCVCGLCGPLN